MESFHEGSTNMDARIWGNLGNYIDLAMIYVKLPIGEFFRLRQVCKEWNRLASDRKFLEESFRGLIPEPYFVVDTSMMGHRLLARDASSGRWTWTPLPKAKCAVAGLLCKYSKFSNNDCVFNLHTRVFHPLPPAPEKIDGDSLFREAMVGITVDTAVSPYGFKVFVGHHKIGTRIYDSKSGAWTQKPSLHSSSLLAWYSLPQEKPYSFGDNGVVYFRVWDWQARRIHLQSYHLERDEWMQGDQRQEPWIPHQWFVFCDIGLWQDRLCYLRLRRESDELLRLGREADATIEVLRLWREADATIEVLEYNVGVCHQDEGYWVVSDRMPEDLKTWLMAGQKYGGGIEMQGVFCGEYVLVYNCAGVEDVTERAVLYNLEGKTWEKLQLPPSWPRKDLHREKKKEEKKKERLQSLGLLV